MDGLYAWPTLRFEYGGKVCRVAIPSCVLHGPEATTEAQQLIGSTTVQQLVRWEFDIPHTQSLYLSVHQPAATASSHAIVFAFEPAVIFRSIMALFNVDEEVTFVVKTPASHLLTTPAIVAESAKAVVDLVDVDVAVDPSPAALVEASNRPSSVVATTVLPAGTLIASVVAAEEGKLVPLKKKQILGKNQVLACFDYTARNVSELSLVAGSVVNVIGRWDANWWKGESNDDIGFFPANHVQGLELVELMEEECKKASTEINYQDSEYFDSYSTLTIHHQMLNDKTRTIAYRDGVVALAAKIKGKLVLDIGCGTGILSMFCARAGAEHVVGVDASSIIKIAAQKVIEENGLQKKITLMTGKLEEIVADLPYPKYDVIISEWMGTFLICESMIESVLWAKDQLLKEGGLLLPSTCSLFLVPVSVPDWYDEKIQFWDSVYGINMSSLKALAKQTFIQKPSDQPLKPVNCLCAEQSVMDIDMHTYTLDQLESNRRDFAFEMTRDAPFHGFGSWFEVHFGDVLFDTGDEHSSANNLNPVFRKSALVTLPTGPDGPLTHWKQISFLMEVPIILKKGQTVSGNILIERNKVWRRHIEVSLSFTAGEKEKSQETEIKSEKGKKKDKQKAREKEEMKKEDLKDKAAKDEHANSSDDTKKNKKGEFVIADHTAEYRDGVKWYVNKYDLWR